MLQQWNHLAWCYAQRPCCGFECRHPEKLMSSQESGCADSQLLFLIPRLLRNCASLPTPLVNIPSSLYWFLPQTFHFRNIVRPSSWRQYALKTFLYLSNVINNIFRVALPIVNAQAAKKWFFHIMKRIPLLIYPPKSQTHSRTSPISHYLHILLLNIQYLEGINVVQTWWQKKSNYYPCIYRDCFRFCCYLIFVVCLFCYCVF